MKLFSAITAAVISASFFTASPVKAGKINHEFWYPISWSTGFAKSYCKARSLGKSHSQSMQYGHWENSYSSMDFDANNMNHVIRAESNHRSTMRQISQYC